MATLFFSGTLGDDITSIFAEIVTIPGAKGPMMAIVSSASEFAGLANSSGKKPRTPKALRV